MVPSPKQLENTLDELGTSIFSVMVWLMEELSYSFFSPKIFGLSLLQTSALTVAQEAAIIIVHLIC